MHYVSTNVFPISGDQSGAEDGERLFPVRGERREVSGEMKSTDAGLLDITEAEAPVGCRAAISDLVRVQVDPDGEGPDEAVDGAVCGGAPVSRVVGDRAED